MKRAAVLMSALAVVLYTVGMSAQAKPNFAGKWTMEMPAGGAMPGGGAPGGGGRGGRGGGRGGAVSGMEVTITQDANTLTINKTQGQNPVTLKINLNGSDSPNTITTGRGEMRQTLMAVWEGDKLTITTSMDMGNGPTSTKQTLSLEGGNLVVENFGADGTAMAKVTYKKAM
jgi:hypothetical protein